ncbi:MAG: adenylate/guanylate cyclase domain-containing protein, partial [Fimbriimonadaceae bacterium]|nr:adenylate/guanylate cyclase domain-containing protein [Fimbriimonadaceae bacterium]
WRLSGEGRDAAILAVDVARSTALKAAADPPDVEYSFREYQALVARTVQEAGGEVFATAGDGALASLPSAEAALLAARTIQTRINRFNQEINRLRDFRLRIGLHAGSSAADFGATQHHELIDIAAHTEGMAPVGGIAATEAFRSRITAEEMAEINAEVDGHKVFIVLRPILEE